MILPSTNELLQQIAIKYGINVNEVENSCEPETVRLLKALNFQILADGGVLELAPLAALTIAGESVLEYGLSGVGLDRSLNWDIDKRTNPIAFILIDGTEIVPTGEDQFGNYPVRLTENVINTYLFLVRDSNSLEAIKSASFYFRHGYYWGAMANVGAITDADIMALNGAGSGEGKVLETTRLKSFNWINGNGNYLVFAFPVSWGDPVFKINGLINNAFTKVRNDNFVNQHGYIEPYQVWASDAQQNAPITEFEIL